MIGYRWHLRLAGMGLIVVGVLDLVRVVSDAVTSRVFDMTPLGILWLVAGALLLAGSHWAARWVGFLSLLYILLWTATLLVGFSVMGLPIGMLWPMVHSFPIAVAEGVLGWVGGLAFAGYIYYACSLALRVEEGTGASDGQRRPWALWTVLGLGVLLIAASVVWGRPLVRVPLERARAEARRKMGPGYEFYVYHFSVRGSGEKSGAAKVIAYNSREARRIEVEWKK